jgi:hypothetical protein
MRLWFYCFESSRTVRHAKKSESKPLDHLSPHSPDRRLQRLIPHFSDIFLSDIFPPAMLFVPIPDPFQMLFIIPDAGFNLHIIVMTVVFPNGKDLNGLFIMILHPAANQSRAVFKLVRQIGVIEVIIERFDELFFD